MFKCYICGKEYETPIEAANCTIDCTKKQEIEKEELIQEGTIGLINAIHYYMED